jgi:rhodanese-related sulfurtransferase/DNA-binding transcriptional ArsR family regulator
MGNRAVKNVLLDQFARVGHALSSGKRLELLDLIAQGERTVDALARASELGLSTASSHLQTLKAAHLVNTRREGTKIFYRLAGPDVAHLLVLVRAVANAHLPDVETAACAYLGVGTEQVTRSELLHRIKTGQVTVIDVRPREEYDAGHIPAAVSVPLDELADHLSELPADHDIVAYCRGAYCVLAHEAVRMLTERGRTAMRLADGMLEWRLADLPVATSSN